MKVAIVTASKNGATRKVADLIAATLEEEYGLAPTLFAPRGLSPKDLLEYEVWLLGSSTWGNGDLHQDMDQLERDLRDLDLGKVWGAAFGTGVSMYPHYCEAVDILENRLKNSGAHIIQRGLKIDSLISLDQEAVRDWARWIGERIKE
jgi:flavodoxin I